MTITVPIWAIGLLVWLIPTFMIYINSEGDFDMFSPLLAMGWTFGNACFWVAWLLK